MVLHKPASMEPWFTQTGKHPSCCFYNAHVQKQTWLLMIIVNFNVTIAIVNNLHTPGSISHMKLLGRQFIVIFII